MEPKAYVVSQGRYDPFSPPRIDEYEITNITSQFVMVRQSGEVKRLSKTNKNIFFKLDEAILEYKCAVVKMEAKIKEMLRCLTPCFRQVQIYKIEPNRFILDKPLILK